MYQIHVSFMGGLARVQIVGRILPDQVAVAGLSVIQIAERLSVTGVLIDMLDVEFAATEDDVQQLLFMLPKPRFRYSGRTAVLVRPDNVDILRKFQGLAVQRLNLIIGVFTVEAAALAWLQEQGRHSAQELSDVPSCGVSHVD